MTNGETDDYHNEIEMAGLYGGGVIGGLVFGSFGDLFNSEVNSLAWYISGAVLGAIAGSIAGRLFRTVALASDEIPEHDGSTQRIHRPR